MRSVAFALVLACQSVCLAKTIPSNRFQDPETRRTTLSVFDANCLVRPSDDEVCADVYYRYLDLCGVMPAAPVCSMVRPRLVTLCGHEWAADLCFSTVAHSCRRCMIDEKDEGCYLFKELLDESKAGNSLSMDVTVAVCDADPDLPGCVEAMREVHDVLADERADHLIARMTKISKNPKNFIFASLSGCYETPEDPFCLGVIQKISSKCKENETLLGCRNLNNNKHVTICLNSKGEATLACQYVFLLVRSSVTFLGDKSPLGKIYKEFLLSWQEARIVIADIAGMCCPSCESNLLKMFVSSGCEKQSCFEAVLLENYAHECVEYERNATAATTAITLDDMLDNTGCNRLVHYGRQNPTNAARVLFHLLRLFDTEEPNSLPKDILKERSMGIILRELKTDRLADVVQDLMEFCVTEENEVCLKFCEALSFAA